MVEGQIKVFNNMKEAEDFYGEVPAEEIEVFDSLKEAEELTGVTPDFP